jgi:hypothetical protein
MMGETEAERAGLSTRFFEERRHVAAGTSRWGIFALRG